MSVQYPDLNNTTFPNIIDEIIQMTGITTTDAPLVKQFQVYMQNADFANAQIILNQIQNASSKIISPEIMNKYRDCILALERFYKSDIEPYIEQKQSSWQQIIDRFSYISQYSPSTTYYKNNYVTFPNSYGDLDVYICTKNPPVGTPPTSTTYWRILTTKGNQGVSGTGGSFRYNWDSSVTYNADDIVVDNNKWWVATEQNINSEPYVGSQNWQIVLEISSATYPYSSTMPTSQDVGQLWFQIISEV